MAGTTDHIKQSKPESERQIYVKQNKTDSERQISHIFSCMQYLGLKNNNKKNNDMNVKEGFCERESEEGRWAKKKG
jgi:hypothetical protein